MRKPSHVGSPIIVGVGASAGGLEAFQELLGELGDRNDFAVVYLQHMQLDELPLHLDLLRKSTTLPVLEITGRKKLKAGTIYVCPPWTLLELKGGSIKLASGEVDKRPETPIDFFLHSLAEEQGERSLGIILSGTGSDGTLGLKSISDAGGMTFAQSPESAKFDSMPRSAAITGVADHVLTPREIAVELKRYASYLSDSKGNTQVPSIHGIHDALPEISKILVEATNHNFQHYKPNTLARRIRRRMHVLKLADITTYVKCLQEDPEEPQALFRELLISVTAFFRDPEAFETIQNVVIPALFDDRRPEDVVRIWVPGCASGEEAFTLAILCREYMEKLESPPEVQIFATDIDDRALKIGRQGVYPLGIEEDISADRLKRFFVKRGKKYHIAKEVRELVLFSSHNLISDPAFSRLDFISCRNLLIYLGSHLQQKLIPVFHYSLRTSGYLMLGPSESISSHGELFEMIDAKNRIAQRKGTGVEKSAALKDSLANTRESALRAEPTKDSTEDLMQVMQRIVLDEFAPKSVIVEENGRILCASADMQKYLTVGMGTFQNNVIKLAKPELRVGLRATIQEAKEKRRRIVHDNLSVQVDGELQRVMITVQPMPRIGEKSEIFMVVFHDVGQPLSRHNLISTQSDAPETLASINHTPAESMIAHLELELTSTREDLERSIQQLEAINEELKSSNEELLSLNEEMQSANEELEASKEEIQAAVNALGQSNSDLENLLRSTRIATIFLDDQLHIRSFTPAATAIYSLISTDIGRPLGQLMPLSSDIPPLPDPDTVTGDDPIEDTIQTHDGHWFVRRVLPYHLQSGERDGIVVTFVDITDQKKVELVLQERAALAALHSKLALSLGSEAPLNNILQACCQQLMSGLKATFACIWLLDEEEQTLQQVASAGMMHSSVDGADVDRRHGELAVKRVAENRRPLCLSSLVDEVENGQVESVNGENLPMFVGYPLIVENRLVGVVALFAERELSAESFELLLPMVDAIAQCIARKRSEQELQRREARLRCVIDNALCFIGILDTRGVLQEANEAALLAGGLSREDVYGKPFWECYWWSHDPQIVKDLKAAIATALQGEVVRYDVEVRMAGDSRLMIDFMLAPVKDSEGNVAYLIPSGVDISERKAAERELQQRVQQLNLALDTGRMGIWEWDINANHVKWSPQLFDMFGYTEASLVPTKEGFLSAVHPDDREKLELLIKSTYYGDCVAHDVEFRVIRGDTGEVVWTHCRGMTLRNAQGEPLSIISVSIDITVRKLRELALTFLASLQATIAGFTSTELIMQTVGERLVEYLQLSHFLIIEIDANAEIANVVFDQPAVGEARFLGPYRMSDFATEDELQLLTHGHPMIINNTADPGRPTQSANNYAELNIGALLNAPCLRNQRLEFMISAVKPTAHEWRDDEVQLLRELSTLLRLKLERAKAEEALRESESKFRDLADNMSQFAWVTDPSGSIFWYNKRWFDYTGTTLEEMEGWGWKNVHHPDHIDRVLKRWQSCLAAGEVWEDTFPLRSKTGEYRWFLSLAHPIRDEDGNILRWFGTNTDVTETKNAEDALRSSEEQLRLGVEVANFALARIDYPSGIIRLSPEAAQLYGFPQSELAKTRDEVHATFHPDDREEMAGYIHEVLNADGDGEFACEHRVVLPNGDVRWLNIRKRVFFDRSVNPPRATHGILAAQDITEQMQWELALAESKERLSMAMESARMGTFEWDPETDHAIWDKQHLALTGLSSSSLKGSDFFALIHPEDAEANQLAIAKMIRGEQEYEIEFRIKRPDGKVRWLSGRGKIVRGDSNRMRFIGLNWDITEAKIQEQRIRESEERLRIAADAAGFGMAHVDLITRTATFSDELRRLIGLTGNEHERIPVHSMPDWIHGDDRRAFAEFVKDLTELKEGSSSSIDLRITRTDGEIRWARLQAKPVFTGSGQSRRPTQIIGTVLDITKQREFEHSLNEAALWPKPPMNRRAFF